MPFTVNGAGFPNGCPRNVFFHACLCGGRQNDLMFVNRIGVCYKLKIKICSVGMIR